MGDQPPSIGQCACQSLSDLAVVPMGGEGQDKRIFAHLDRIRDHGGDQWWLYLSVCATCGHNWMVAQDDRIYDNFYLRRLDPEAADAIRHEAQWPAEFLTYERVLSLGRTWSKAWTFLDPRSPALVWAAEDLRRERPEISVDEIADLLGVPVRQASRLLRAPGLIDRLRAWTLRL